MEIDMNAQQTSAIRELTAQELDQASGGLVREIYDAVTAVDMAAQWVYALAVMAMRDPWA
jgi:hypothetical protein